MASSKRKTKSIVRNKVTKLGRKRKNKVARLGTTPSKAAFFGDKA